ncbi:maleylacetate reductase [Shimwellia blattae]|uniref:Putative iron-containing alcohol dehydrogenase n=1 Tax=Shimwellia blattae (strain ATCC 29907 / DSM 4481 / JCM 1650 / NBRC 105725 / CDC 9005-74) TaxID=630626 RepID=I2B6T9_SHIBC|nr:maleylacetate reductase [Shimwellia blattae]AFJ46243.1 putative iron-containing alcohol dehydrogenase [Shimwellia blattae DSM 4481 = NBRC 105725]GAB81121.1 putative alcohol dehydrogenase [Shimwellia blattae DSM 4481 = NBRC 105725]VDY63708.1 Maleylacetate reductase [Shimwellia blattae]VEC21850.1 Maleylacetate reductase [Shimwellia blattae]
MTPFIYTSRPARIRFGAGSLQFVAEEMDALGCRRALLLSTPDQQDDAQRLAHQLGERCAGLFSRAVMHTPVEVTEQALACFEQYQADCVIALGGGSTTGLGKAIAWRNNTPQIVIPTTYAGSEVTPVLGQTSNGIKHTLSDPSVLPEVVIYDPELTFSLPVSVSITSGLNAMAHAIEGLYARDRNPVTSLIAVEGIRALHQSLPVIARDPADSQARSQALYGAWLCGTVLGSVGMALHHKLCHTLGGSFNLPHAQTHAVMLPHTLAWNQHVAARELQPLAAFFGDDLACGVFYFAGKLGAPQSLQALGIGKDDLDQAADIAVSNPYWNPRPIEQTAIRALLQRAWSGHSPA